MSKCHLMIDVALCENCCNCFLSVKDEYCGNEFPEYSLPQPQHGHRWFDVLEMERGAGSLMDVAYLPVTCNQCAEAPCVKASKNGEIRQRKDGIVIIDPLRARGKKELVESCPYGCIWWNHELQVPQKWSFDAHLLDNGWAVPRPVQSCGTGALTFIKASDEDIQKRAESEELKVLHPEFGTKPRIWYKNLYRFEAAFIAGSLSYSEADRIECAAGAELSLHCPDDQKLTCQSDAFGDFKFDGLSVETGEYLLEIQYADYPLKRQKVVLAQSTYLGEIRLSPSD